MVFDINNFGIDGFLERYPEMRPYVGEKYGEAQENRCALLVIGESHYLPKKSSANEDCKSWYSSNSTKLDEKEKGWINTQDIIDAGIGEGFSNRAHGIWKNGYAQINCMGPKFENYCDLFKYTVFYNYYLRPARCGDTFKNICEKEDKDIANLYFKSMVEKHKPNGIIFLSRFAYDSCEFKENLTIPIAGAPHPSCCWWNRKSEKYGNRYGREVCKDGMKGFDWNWVEKGR